MSSAKEARKIIEEIRRDQTLDGTINQKLGVVKLLRNALAVLSDQLYDKSTHFILELIQNADDNSYENRTPTLNFTYNKGSLRIDCNEMGFTPSNVQAICAIGDSTKTGIDHSTRFIGEKGIGFKSVFKVADVVSISSRHFSFKFDRNEELGMVAPIWSEFPEQKLEGYTSFQLELSKDCDETELVEEIRRLDAGMLIFLRQLKEINLTVNQADGSSWKRRLHRTDSTNDGAHFTTLSQDQSPRRYTVTKHHVDGLPSESKRPGCSGSDILLAFPVPEINKPLPLISHSVYAFLPIRDYGLPFLLQADFLLTANREDIDKSSAWNRTIRDAALDAFVNAILDFSKGNIRYLWPQYLPTGHISYFFETLKTGLAQKLGSKPVLESYGGDMVVPASLTFVPPHLYSDSDGIPFALSSHTKSKYLSLKYPKWVIAPLYSLGVQMQSAKAFLQDLERMISTEPKDFQSKPLSWHSQLAKALSILATEEVHRKSLLDIALIPLRSGEWVSARKRKIFFSKNAKGLNIPNSVHVDIVHPDAEQDTSRRNLLTHLGVKACEAAQICQIIVDMHAEFSFEPYKFSRAQLLSHTLFLFQASWNPPDDAEIWFATTTDRRCKGSELYIHGGFPNNSSAARISQHLETKFPFIHLDYINAITDGEKWQNWLCDSFHLATLPRIVSNASKSSADRFSLSEEFQFIFQRCWSSDVLLVLRDHWHHYSYWVDDHEAEKHNPESRQSREGLRSSIASMTVKCKNGGHVLHNTVLPALDKTVDENQAVHTLDIKDPKNQKWGVLSHFGVAVKKDVAYYLKCLEHMQGTSLDKHVPAHIYEKIQGEYSSNEEIVWAAFREKTLIYTMCGSNAVNPRMRWIDAKECIQKRLNLEAEYQQSATLFRCLLATGQGEIGPIIAAATLINSTNKLAQISQHFIKISRALNGMNSKKAEEAVVPMKHTPIFPVIQKRGIAEYDSLVRLGDATSWFVADRDHLRESFRGVVSFLAFSAEDLEDIESLMKALKLESRILSNLVKSENSPRGQIVLSGRYTRFLRAKAPFIIALIPNSNPKQDAVSKCIRQVQVSTAERIAQNYVFTVGGIMYKGQDGEGDIAFKDHQAGFHIFMNDRGIQASCPPMELTDVIAKYCGIPQGKPLSMLQHTLSETNLNQLWASFRKEGFNIPKTALDSVVVEEPKKYASVSGDVPTAPYTDNLLDGEMKSAADGLSGGFRRVIRPESGQTRSNRSTGSAEKSKDGKTASRQLPMKKIVQKESGNSKAVCGNSNSTAIVVQSNDTLYIGELMVSKLFSRHLGSLYNPVDHWTSSLRSRAGHPAFIMGDTETHSSFTIADRRASQKITEVLIAHGYAAAKIWRNRTPTYHFDVALVPGDVKSPFSWTTPQYDRIRKFRLMDKTKVNAKDVVVLVRLCNPYSEPIFDLFVDPWNLVLEDKFLLNGQWGITATIAVAPSEGTSSKIQPLQPEPQQFQSKPPTPPTIAHSSYFGGRPPISLRHLGLNSPINYPYGSVQSRLPSPPYGPDLEPQGPYIKPNTSSSTPYYSQPLLPPSYYPAAPHSSIPQPNMGYPPHFRSAHSGTGISNPIGSSYQYSPYSSAYYQDYGGFSSRMSRQSSNPSPPNLTTIEKHVEDVSSIKPLQVAVSIAKPDGTFPDYAYKPLNEGQIRLVMLLPGKDDEALQVIVFHIPLEKSGDYRAVSYAWGSEKRPHSLFTPDGVISSTTTLQSTLKSLRNRNEVMMLWVDAICINQNDILEKTVQVPLLPRIFLRATCVLACIEGDAKIDTAIETLMQIQARDALKDSDADWPLSLPAVPSSWGEDSIPPQGDPVWQTIATFFRKPWFSRAWIVQEVVTASSTKMICGKWIVDWNDLHHAVDVLERETNVYDERVYPCSSWKHFLVLAGQVELEAQGYRFPLIDLLEQFRHTKCTFQRDFFFSLLGIAADADEVAFAPDYESPFEVIVRRYACAMIGQGRVMQLLYRAGLSSEPARFPSWIPNWTIERQPSLYSLCSAGMKCDAAGTERQPEAKCDAGSDELQISGYIVDEIRSISQASNTNDQLKAYFEEVDLMIDSLPSYPVKETKFVVKWKVPIAGVEHPKVANSGGLDMGLSYIALRRHLAAGPIQTHKKKKKKKNQGPTISNEERETLEANSQNYLLALQGSLSGWRFFITKRGYVGVAPPEVRERDTVVVFAGGAVPFLLRESTWREQAYHVVGECYVHGIMDGEGLELQGVKRECLRLH